LKFKILKNDLVTVLHRSVIRSAADDNHWSKRLSFSSDVQESLKLLDTKSSFVQKDIQKDSHHKHKSRRTNNDVSNRTRSKADYSDQHIGSRTRSKMHCVNYLSFQILFFPLHDRILFQGHGKYQSQDLK
jgi:outer membrane protease